VQPKQQMEYVVMKQLNLIFVSVALTCLALFPAAASAAGSDELDVTFEVFDSIAGLDGRVLEMRGPEAEGPDGQVDEDESYADGEMDDDYDAGETESDFDTDEQEVDDDFESDDDFEVDDEDMDLDEDDDNDLDEGEDIDTDEPDDDDDEMEPDDDDLEDDVT